MSSKQNINNESKAKDNRNFLAKLFNIRDKTVESTTKIINSVERTTSIERTDTVKKTDTIQDRNNDLIVGNEIKTPNALSQFEEKPIEIKSQTKDLEHTQALSKHKEAVNLLQLSLDNKTTVLKKQLEVDILENRSDLNYDIKGIKEELAENLKDARPSKVADYKSDANDEIETQKEYYEEEITNLKDEFESDVEYLKDEFEEDKDYLDTDLEEKKEVINDEDDEDDDSSYSSSSYDYSSSSYNSTCDSSLGIGGIFSIVIVLVGIGLVLMVGYIVMGQVIIALEQQTTTTAVNVIGTNVTTQTIGGETLNFIGSFPTMLIFVLTLPIVWMIMMRPGRGMM